MILEKLHRAINNFNKTFNWRRFRRDALRCTWEKACWCSACCMAFFQP